MSYHHPKSGLLFHILSNRFGASRVGWLQRPHHTGPLYCENLLSITSVWVWSGMGCKRRMISKNDCVCSFCYLPYFNSLLSWSSSGLWSSSRGHGCPPPESSRETEANTEQKVGSVNQQSLLSEGQRPLLFHKQLLRLLFVEPETEILHLVFLDCGNCPSLMWGNYFVSVWVLLSSSPICGATKQPHKLNRRKP